MIGRFLRYDRSKIINGTSTGDILIDPMNSLPGKNTWGLGYGATIRHATREEIDEALLHKRIFTLTCEGGTFEIEVSTKGILYAPENALLDVSGLRAIITDSNKGRTISGYTFLFKHVDSGCKKRVPIADWEEVIKYYDSITGVSTANYNS